MLNVWCVWELGALLVQQAKCALSMEKALSDVKDKLAHHQQEACTLSFCLYLVITATRLNNGQVSKTSQPRAGSGVVRIDLLRFLAGCRTRRLHQV